VRSRYPDGVRMALASRSQITAKLVSLDAAGFDQMAVEVASAQDAAAGVLPTQAAINSRALEWIEATLERGAAEGASDIHFWWSLSKRLRLRMRIDGALRDFPVPLNINEQREAVGALLAKCPGVDSTNVREPIDGTFSFMASGSRVDVRLGMLPQSNGPTIVLRLLDPRNVAGSLDTRGFAPDHIATIRKILGQPYGMMVVVGPTGSGKSTTLYTCLAEIDANARVIHTVEDPVEYRLDNINQTPVRDDLGSRSITFQKALRSILRLDPDVILLGEMRDTETANVGLKASLTGHLVLTTLHANTAVQTFTRLVEMGVPPFLVADAVDCSVSQRLLRTVHDCFAWRDPSDEERQLLDRHGFSHVTKVPHAVGCDGCQQSGYRGRAAVLEVLSPNEEIRDLIRQQAPMNTLAKAAEAAGFRPLMADGLRLVSEGRTTMSEARRVVLDNTEIS
jgi:type II secretory ATPase GspE/PulE/Tfp pilus assembly ATPase PilB-like protein